MTLAGTRPPTLDEWNKYELHHRARLAIKPGMYKPIAEDDTKKICALMKLYRLYYRVIGFVIGGVGLVLTPFVPKLISGDVPSGLNIYILYLMNLAATVP